jgi:hypothetical protein
MKRFAVFSHKVKVEAQVLMEASGFGFVDLFTRSFRHHHCD